MSKLNIKNIHKYFEKKSKYYDNIKNSLLFILIASSNLFNLADTNIKAATNERLKTIRVLCGQVRRNFLDSREATKKWYQ